METSIPDFFTSFYIPAIKKILFHLPYVHIIGTNNCGNTCSKEFKLCSLFQNGLRCIYYSEIVLASFAHQIQSEYYGVNIYVSIEVILFYHFSAITQTGKV